MMITAQEERMALLANDLFNKRQRLIKASQPAVDLVDERTVKVLETEYRAAESDYLEAKAAFARAMKSGRRAV